MALNPNLRRLREAGVSIWLDTLSRELLESGGFAELVSGYGVTGATSNPTIFAKAITDSDLSVPNTPSVAVLASREWIMILAAMITGHVPTVRFPAGHAPGCMVAAVPAQGILEGRRDPAAAPPARGSAVPAQVAVQAFMGGPCADRGTAQRDPARPPSQPADDRDPRHGLALASRNRAPTLGSQVPA
jgi:hypothetical protein